MNIVTNPWANRLDVSTRAQANKTIRNAPREHSFLSKFVVATTKRSNSNVQPVRTSLGNQYRSSCRFVGKLNSLIDYCINHGFDTFFSSLWKIARDSVLRCRETLEIFYQMYPNAISLRTLNNYAFQFNIDHRGFNNSQIHELLDIIANSATGRLVVLFSLFSLSLSLFFFFLIITNQLSIDQHEFPC